MSKYTQDGILSIVYDLWISGTKMGPEKKLCINSIEIKETVVGSDVATIQIADPEFLYIEDNIFIEDNKIKITMGWDNTTHRVEFNGYISAIDIDFNSSGIPQLTVTCMDNTHKMNRVKKDATFQNCTSADAVKKIVQSYGFQCVVDGTYPFVKQETITQSQQTDIDFITKLASQEVHPFTARLVGNTFYYVKMGNITTPTMSLTYRQYPHEIISFSPQINKETKKTAISNSTVDTATKSVTTSKGSYSKGGNGSASSGSTSSGFDSTSNSRSYTYNPRTKTWSSR